ncbi:MAG: aminomethyl-transferring glycine dehydrogenase [Deltaproteobacteria bacterium]|nr:aminomethyl-transferring glycine dehydrogenase [Deltaproteobacteria bacterium]
MSQPEHPSLAFSARFSSRHTGPNDDDIRAMLEVVGQDSLEKLIDDAVPKSIRMKQELQLEEPKNEAALLEELRVIANENSVWRSFIGTGYSNTHVPAVIQRNVLENPGWYTQYTPYQSEISQGRLEALLNFQTMIKDLTGMDLANASMLDEATAVAEAVSMLKAVNRKNKSMRVLVDKNVHPQSLAVTRTRASPLGFDIETLDLREVNLDDEEAFCIVVQYPGSCGKVAPLDKLIEAAHAKNMLVVCATDLLALTLLESPGAQGADVVVGNSQRFGVPMGFGGPHAAFFATRDAYKRQMPGRMVGVSKDKNGHVAYRLTLQTREQHIRREKATSNICTSQVLLAIMAGMYGVYHGPKGLKDIAERVHFLTEVLSMGLKRLEFSVVHAAYFDTLKVELPAGKREGVLKALSELEINVRILDDESVCISLDEATKEEDVRDLLIGFNCGAKPAFTVGELAERAPWTFSSSVARRTPYLTHDVFHHHRSETEMLRYLTRLQAKDLSLTTSMIPLGSCTMKLNATTEMIPIGWPEFSQLHPFVPPEQARGYHKLLFSLEGMLAEITGMDSVSLQPNAGSQGEYAGLQVIRAAHDAKGESGRKICLIPSSAHGTNPASAALSGLEVVVVPCDKHGNINLDSLKELAEKHSSELAALMITYPSTHGVFEPHVEDVCKVVHEHGGLVYLDGANMNAQVGLCRPGDYGADVCHLNLHKTFAIPHGGGGPGVGPIAVKEALAPYLPGHPLVSPFTNDTDGENASGAVSAAPWGSAGVMAISWMYIALLGGQGLKKATQTAVLNANYMQRRLERYFDILYRGETGLVAHEFILDCRELKEKSHISVEDIAKRLMDYGFHAPTMSWPVAGTLMIEPTESESKAELDRLCDALISIRTEIQKVEDGEWDLDDNPLVNAPHTATMVTADEWKYAYSRQVAAYPAPWSKERKFWPAVARIDNVYGDRNVVCECPPLSEYE